MPAQKKTKNLQLNQWTSNEYPKMIDFNEDNAIIDDHISRKLDISIFENQIIKKVDKVKVVRGESLFDNSESGFFSIVEGSQFPSENGGLIKIKMNGSDNLEENVNLGNIFIADDEKMYFKLNNDLEKKWHLLITLEDLEKLKGEYINLLNKMKNDVEKMQNDLFNDITKNPWSLIIDDLSDVKRIRGVFNEKLQRIEC